MSVTEMLHYVNTFSKQSLEQSILNSWWPLNRCLIYSIILPLFWDFDYWSLGGWPLKRWLLKGGSTVCVKAFQLKVINSFFSKNSKLLRIGHISIK